MLPQKRLHHKFTSGTSKKKFYIKTKPEPNRSRLLGVLAVILFCLFLGFMLLLVFDKR